MRGTRTPIRAMLVATCVTAQVGGAFGQGAGPVLGLRTTLDEDSRRGATSRRTVTLPSQRDRQAPQGAERPTFGNPPGSGAGSTGYLSTNAFVRPAPAGNAARQAPPRTQAATPALRPGDLRPARPGSPATGALRPGASIDVPPGTTTRPIRRPVDEEPFEPLGIRVGAFLLRPSLEVTGGYDTNPSRVTGGRGSWFTTIAPELLARSDWSRHELTANLRGSYSLYDAVPSLNRPFFDGRVNGRIDVTRQTQINVEAHSNISTDNPGSPDLQADLASLPIYTAYGGSVGIGHRFNRFEITAKGGIDRTTYDNSVLTDGSVVSNEGRNFNQYSGLLRLGYELTPGMKPFVEGQYDQRVRDLEFDAFGIRRDSQGTTARIGTTFEFSRKLTGEASIGYLVRTYKDPSLPELRGVIADGSLIWAMSGLTSVKLTARSSGDESTLPGVAGVLRRDVGVQVDHAFRRWLLASARIGYGHDRYEGSIRTDDRYVVGVGVTYKMTRSIHIKGEVRHEWLRSTQAGFNYDATIGLLGVRLQR